MKSRNPYSKLLLLPWLLIWIIPSYYRISAKTITMSNRSELPYEITSSSITNQRLNLAGWGYKQFVQNYYDESTHSYSLLLEGANGHMRQYSGSLRNVDHTEMNSIAHFKTCTDQQLNTDQCNHIYQNIGFRFSIPLSDLQYTSYKVYLIIDVKQTGIRYQVPMAYAMTESFDQMIGQDRYVIRSLFDDAYLRVFAEQVFARYQAGKAGQLYRGNQSCSSMYGNIGYFKQGGTFSNALARTTINEITYYQVRVKEYGCIQGRLNLVESYNATDPLVWLPGHYVDYGNKPTTISRDLINNPPVITASNTTLDWYVGFTLDLRSLATAYDPEEGDLTDRIQVSSKGYEPFPGTYQISYRVADSYQIMVTKTIKLTIRYQNNQNPVITAYDLEMRVSDDISPMTNVSAYDYEDGDITSSIVIAKNTLDSSTPGTYEQCFRVTDRMGASDYKCRSIIVKDTIKEQRMRFISPIIYQTTQLIRKDELKPYLDDLLMN